MIDLTGTPRPWPGSLRRAFAAALLQASRDADAWYTPPSAGDPHLLERLVELSGVPVDRTVVTSGIRQAVGCLAGLTRWAVVETPSFREVPAILGGATEVLRHRWEEIPDAVSKLPGRGLIWLTSPARNPDGRSLTPEEREELSALVDQGHMVVINQIYRWHCGRIGHPPRSDLAELPRGGWGATSLSKVCGGGSRLGWLVLPMPAVPPQLRVCGPATIWQRAWARFLSPDRFERLWLATVEPGIAARTAFVVRMKELLGLAWRAEGLSLGLACAGTTEARLVAALAGRGISASPGSAFGLAGTAVRLAFSAATVSDARSAAERIHHLAQASGLSFSPL